jgi:tRNA modification GTPase
MERLAGTVPPARQAKVASIRHADSGEAIDNALIIFFAGPASATGEDVAEFHLHGGRAIVAEMLSALDSLDGLRRAEPGEFTRRAFDNGRIDLAEAEGLADLLAAETQSQRRAAMSLASGALSREVAGWQTRLLGLAAGLEAVIDFSDEGEVGEAVPAAHAVELRALAADLERALARPSAERLKDGVRVAIAGPPNAGKSSLFNALVQRDAAIVSPVEGTTRDLVEAPVALAGAPFLLVDTAGLRDADGLVEEIGVARAREAAAAADLLLWLGEPEHCPDRSRAIVVEPKGDLRDGPLPPGADLRVSSLTGNGLVELVALLGRRAAALLPREGEAALNARHRSLLGECLGQLKAADAASDVLLAAESLRQARVALDRVTGRAGVEDMLDAVFSRFCVGK